MLVPCFRQKALLQPDTVDSKANVCCGAYFQFQPGSLVLLPQGALIPEFHGNYWMGLKSIGSWPNFTWVDPFAVGPNATTYLHWGKGEGALVPEEPNNFDPQEDCGAANYTQSYDLAWGWADAKCTEKFVFMCKCRGGWPQAGLTADAA